MDVGVRVGAAVGVEVGVVVGPRVGVVVGVEVGVEVGVGVGGAAPTVMARDVGLFNPVAAPERVRSGATLPLAVRA
jgi:hypothetical protein